MSWSEFEVYRYEKLMEQFCAEHGPPQDIWDKLKWGYELDQKRQSVVLYEVRPQFGDPENKIHIPVFKAVYVKSKDLWKIYWMKSDMKWHGYDPEPEADSLREALDILSEDKYCYFFG